MRLLRIVGLLLGLALTMLSVSCGFAEPQSLYWGIGLESPARSALGNRAATPDIVRPLLDKQYLPLHLSRRDSGSREKPYTHILFAKCDPQETYEVCGRKMSKRSAARIMLELARPTTNTAAKDYAFTGNVMVIFQNVNPEYRYFCEPIEPWSITAQNIDALSNVRTQMPPAKRMNGTLTKKVNGVLWECNV